MINTLRSEWVKLRTVTVHWVLALVAVAFPIVVAVLNSLLADFTFGGESSELAELIAGLGVVSAMLFGAMSTISLTSEYSHNTIRPTYAATPQRLRVVAAKLLVNSGAALLLMLATAFGAWGISSPIRSGRDAPVSLGDPGVVRPMVAVGLLAVVVGWFGFALGLMIRNSPATITIFLLWPLLIEGLVAGLMFAAGWSGATKWLPYRAAISSLAGDTGDELGWPGGLVWFAAVSVALLAFGIWLDRRRDA